MADMINIEREHLLKKNKEAAETLARVGPPDIRSVPELIFVTYFLPMFAAEVKQTVDLMNQWSVIAGDLTRPVDILDASGRIVIRVPPIRSSTAYAPITARTQGIDYDIKIASSGARRDASQFLVNGMLARYQYMLKSGNMQQDEQAWIALFKHYGKWKDDAKAVVADSSGDDLYDY
jgi:hypothetical protein